MMLSRDQIKWFAFVTMVIDHIGCMFLSKKGSPQMYFICRTLIGRMAFPIFCALMVDGFFKTRQPWRHVLDLMCFGIVSEFVFDYVGTQGLWWVNLTHQNVMFTWAMAYVMLIFLKYIDQTVFVKWMKYLFTGAVVFGFAYTSDKLCLDYRSVAMFSVFLCYVTKKMFPEVPLWILCLMAGLCVSFSYMRFSALLGVIPCYLYDSSLNKRQSVFSKYLYYFMYPLHLGLITAVGIFVNRLL